MDFMHSLLFSTPKDGSQPGGGMSQLILLVVMMLVFYLFIILPGMRKRKKQRNFVSTLERGQSVVTLGGIHGKVGRTHDDGTLDIEISHGTYIKIERSSISMELTEALSKNSSRLGERRGGGGDSHRSSKSDHSTGGVDDADKTDRKPRHSGHHRRRRPAPKEQPTETQPTDA